MLIKTFTYNKTPIRKQVTSIVNMRYINVYEIIRVKRVKVKCTLVQALSLCTGRMARRWSRVVALTFHDRGTRRG